MLENIKFVEVIVPVRYEEEDIPNDFPFRKNDMLNLLIDAKTGEIIDFPEDIEKHLYMKVVDTGVYRILDENRNVIKEIEGYVPDTSSIPGKYGDYLDFKIKDGKIKNWYVDPEFNEFFEQE